MESLVYFPEYVWAVLHYWAALMTGGAAMLVLGIIERRRGGQISWGRYLTILAITLFVGCYLAWKKERRDKLDAISRLESTLSDLKELKSKQGDNMAFIGMGPLAERPSNPTPGGYYLATDAGYPIYWTGSAWINATGAKVP